MFGSLGCPWRVGWWKGRGDSFLVGGTREGLGPFKTWFVLCRSGRFNIMAWDPSKCEWNSWKESSG